MRANIITKRIQIMNTREKLILQTLKFKQSMTGTGNSAFVDHLLDQNPEKADEITKNVCARIPLQMFEDMEGMSVLLDLNKREIMTMALSDFLEKAKATVTEFKAWPNDMEPQFELEA
jgi:hypothetical protein